MADSQHGDNSFGQKLPPLHIYLKRVLDKYPEGGQILKELVQNADDANARNVVFLYDKSEHPRQRLWSDALSEFQGPALYAYNDASFTQEDWENIQHPEQSGKRKDPTKVGRFGLGFISVYHLTDMPCILSEDHIGYLDPQEQHFNYDPHTKITYVGQRGKRWKLSPELLDDFPDQFSPFLNELFECNASNFQNGKFKGTVFRFPLRKTPSKISASVFHGEDRVNELFESFQTDAELSLLFLKNVESIAVYERFQSNEHPRLIFNVQIRQEDRHHVRINTAAFLSQITEQQDYNTVSCVHIERQLGPQPVGTTNRYITINDLKNKNTSSELKELIDDEELRFLPWMGMSFRISSTAEPGMEEPNGRVFCFLPLPESVQTGLPVHVHGYFGLGDNRRSIKWPDQESKHDNKALWNHLLVTEVLPDVYASLILAAIEKSQDPTDPMQPRDVYNAWPRIKTINSNWSDGVGRFLRLLQNEAIFYADHNGGCWMKSADVYINTKHNDLISKVLKQKGYPVSELPDHVVESLRWAGVHYKELTPAVLRTCIRGDQLQFLTRGEKLRLLEYVISDGISELNNLYLLPLQNDDFTSFCETGPKVFIATSENPSTLIPNGERRFAASDMPAVLKEDRMAESVTQLKILCITDVAPLLLEMLPSTWSNFPTATDTLPWTPGVDGHPSVEWLTILWEWLTKNNMQLPLSTFKDFPLIPMPHNRIARLKENRMIFSKQQKSQDPVLLSENVCSFLESVGAVVIKHDLLQISCHPHLKSFIKAPTPEGVMTLLESFSHSHSTLHIRGCVASMAPAAKDELLALLAQPTWKILQQQKDILRELPLFVASSGKYVSAERCIAAVPDNYFQIPVTVLQDGFKYILLRGISDNLALSLGILQISVGDLLSENILPAVAARFYSVNDSQEIMSWVLERPEFDDLIRKLEFIPTSAIDGQLSSPSDVFVPTSTLKVLFRGKNVFPTGVYAEGKLLKCLQRVGMKNQSDITPGDVLESSVEVSESQAMCQADVERGVVLLEHINCYPQLLSENVLKNQVNKPLHKFLEELFWVPCESLPPQGYPASAGWKGNSETLYSPTDVGLIDSALLHGSVLPFVKLPNIREELLTAFSWSKTLDPRDYQQVELAVLHLKNVASTFNPNEEPYAFSHSASVIYKFLSEASDAQLIDIFAEHMNGSQPWVWHGSGFTTSDKIALSIGNLGVSLVPYLHIVPNDIQKYSAVLAKLGVQQTFKEKELCTVLLSVQHKNQTDAIPSREDYQTDLNLVCNILRYIVNLDKFVSQTSKILVPCRMPKGGDRHLNMVQASECLYVDEERLAAQLFDEETKEEFDKPVIHESISNDLAQHLGLLPLSHFLAPVDEVEYDMAGPHETTVNAIKRNLDMYKNDVDIFKELIQNADDAGATDVKFLLDWRRNEQTAHNLLSDGMKACNGPALWAYNDACFSKEDIKNICSIAAQSKKHQLDKVGRFGLGFTSVYHLTDVPSVVSGPYVLICDPRTIHLGSRVKPGQPGIKLDLSNERHRRTLKSYPNQFQPYNGIFGCDLHPSTEGFRHTLFRLPLRTEFGADCQQPNQLSDFVCDSKEKFNPLLESLKKSSASLLLFTQNVVHVSVQELSDNSEMSDVMSVTVSKHLQMPRSIASDKEDLATERNLLKATAECIEDSSLPVPETTIILKVTQKMCASEESVEPKEETKYWYFITSSCMGRGEILELARTTEGSKAGVLPCGGIAAHLVHDGGGFTPVPIQGGAFSYLPLNVSTGLPFHVNGNFLLQPNRRQLWGKSSSGTDEFEARWNSCFIKSVLRCALINLLQDLQILQQQNIVDAREFQSLWPRRNACEGNFYPLVDAYYHTIGRENHAPSVIFNQSGWVSVQECFFTDWNATDPMSLRSSIKATLAKHLDPKKWVELHPDVVSSISQAGANKCFDVNTFSVERFLREVFFPTLVECRHIEPDHQKDIVLHVLDLRLGERKVTDYDRQLKTTSCIPVSPHGDKLVSPDKLVNPCSTTIGSLYSEDDCRFPHGTEYRKEARLLSLTELGMASNDLSWEDICERAESMLKGGQFENQSATLLKLIDKKLGKNDEPTSMQKMRIQRAAFLPVLKKPENYPTTWYTCGTEFMSAEMLYESKHKDLLGSVQPLLDEERLGSGAMSHKVKTFLGIQQKEAAVTDVIKQLTTVINQASSVLQETSAMIFRIVSFLQDAICSFDLLSGPRVNETHRGSFTRLCALRFVLCDGDFRECKQLAFSYSRSGPYLFQVPPTIKCRFMNLLKLCGVRDTFEVQDYLQTLQLLKTKFQQSPLPEADLKTAKAMMSDIVSESIHKPDRTRNSLHSTPIFVPDNCGILRTPEELTFNDVDWEGSWGTVVYTHPDISFRDAKVFGIITQREKQLNTCSASSGFEMDFGQHEELTDRLSSILRSYPNVSDVFKELLQNADDAGATEIHFIYDPRRHQARKIISDSWAAVQDCPSLCVFNDKPFTKADLKGIQKVGVGGKRDDIATTGKFGIGFNAVYHLTDCPSFLSNGDTLCVFDPLLKYVPGTRKTSPGRMFSTGEPFRELYPDMLRGYLEDTYDFSAKGGTMFRFPLRIKPSVISSEVFSPLVMHTLLEDFQKVSQDALLFLNNIKKIEISSIDKQTDRLKNQYSISAKLSEEDQQHRVGLTEHLKLFSDQACETIPHMSCVYNLMTQDSAGTEQSWLISQILGFKDLVLDGQSLSSAAFWKKPLPRGGVAALIGDSKIEKNYKAYCCLPLPIYTALPVHVNGTFELDSARKNLKKGDAYAGALASTEDSLIHRWNRLLVENVIAPAYAMLVEHAGRKILGKTRAIKSLKDSLRVYDDLFPKDLEAVHGEWRLLSKATLRYIGKNNLHVLPVMRPARKTPISWHHPNSLAFFDTLDLEKDSNEMGGAARSNPPSTSSSNVLRALLLKIGFKLLASSPKLCSAFQACDVDAKFVSSQAVVQHLSTETVITPGLPAPLKKTAFNNLKTFCVLFDYCLDGVTKPVELDGLPLRLANDDTLSQFTTKDALYITTHWTVLPTLGEMFLHKDLVKSCTDWFENNNISEEAFTSGVFKKFTITELGQHLGDHLPEDWQGCKRHVEWKPTKKGHPSVTWLRHLWKFICSETSDEKSQQSLKAIENWPVFPTTSGKLVPPSQSKTVLFLHALGGVGFRSEVASALRKLGLPEIAWKQMCHPNATQPTEELSKLFENHLALPKAHGDVIRVIQFMSETSAIIGNLSPPECNTLLHYFQEGYDKKTLTEENIQTIRKLPIFKLQGESKTTAIQDPQHYHTVEGYEVCMVEANIWMKHMKCVLLEPCPYLNLIYKELGITSITHAGIYLKYILPSFHRLSQGARLQHIMNIRDKVLRASWGPYTEDQEDQEAILHRLSQTPLILDQSNSLQRADYFFDPANLVFRAMVNSGKLLPEPMGYLRDFLDKIGLHTTVTRKDFIEFAQEVETRATQITCEKQLRELCGISRLLNTEIRCNESLHDQYFLQSISCIRFIPSEPIKQELLDIYPAYSSSEIKNPYKVPFIAFRGSVPGKYLQLVWSVSMLLPSWAVPSNSEEVKGVKLHSCLGIETEESEILQKVLAHTKLVCGKMEKNNVIHKKDTLSKKVRSTVRGVMVEIFEHLKCKQGKYCDNIKCCLKCTPICPVEEGRVFIRADQLVFDMDHDDEVKLRPYLYKAPRELGGFDAVLKLLGTQRSCSFDQLAGVLSAMKNECAEKQLDKIPKDLATAKCAVRAIFKLLRDKKESCEISVPELYLPSSGYILRKVPNLYYADSNQMEQLKLASDREFVIPLRDCGFVCKNEKAVIGYLPVRLCPKYLEDELQEKPCETNEDCSDGEHCPYLAHIKRMLNSEEMTQALLRLYQHQLKEKEIHDGDVKCVGTLQSFSNLFCKTELKLGFYNTQGKKIAEQQHTRKAFFDKATSRMFLEHTWPLRRHMGTTFSQIAKCCNDLVGTLLDDKHVALLQSALDCPSPYEMNDILSQSDIPHYDEEGLLPQTHRPGTIVPLDTRHFLDDDPFNLFLEEEIVGYKRNVDELLPQVDDSLSAGTRTMTTRAMTTRPDSASINETTEVIYAVIVEQMDKDNESSDLSRRYKIDIGEQEHIIVSMTTLFKFLRPEEKQEEMSLDANLPEDPQRDREQIEREVREVFTLPKEEQKRVIHRLYRKWHPDKNPDQQKRTNEAFIFLKEEINKHDGTNQYSQHYSHWESEVNRDREEATRYQRRYNQNRRRNQNRGRRQNRSSSNYVPFSFTKEAPDPRRARLWFRQAKEHFNSAEQTNQLAQTQVPWTAFMIHQAAEVALKAAQYNLTGRPNSCSNDLGVLASAVCQHRYVPSNDLIKVAGDLERLDCLFDKPRYPESLGSRTSGQMYQGFSTERALILCKELLNLVRDIIGIKEF